jgi:succinate-acetate transporter protein
MWAHKARDGVATAIHGMWGSFWMAHGVLSIIFAVGKPTPPTCRWPEIGFWFIVLAAITWVAVAAAVAENRGFVTLLSFLAAGSTTAAIGELTGAAWLMTLTGYLFIIAAVAAGGSKNDGPAVILDGKRRTGSRSTRVHTHKVMP